MTTIIESVDLLIEAKWIVPVEPAGAVLENHAVAVNKGRIVGILPQSEVAARFSPCRRKRLDRHVLIPAGCPETSRILLERGYECHPLPMSEFIKSGGACKCLVLRLSADPWHHVRSG